MTATATGTTPQAAAPGRNRAGWIAAAVLAGAVLAVITVLAVMLAGQGSQIAALRGAVTAASQAAATAQHQAATATSAATAAGKTRSAADNANLGVCVSYGNGYAGHLPVRHTIDGKTIKFRDVICYRRMLRVGQVSHRRTSRLGQLLAG